MGDIIYPFSNFNDAAIRVSECASNFIPPFAGYQLVSNTWPSVSRTINDPFNAAHYTLWYFFKKKISMILTKFYQKWKLQQITTQLLTNTTLWISVRVISCNTDTTSIMSENLKTLVVTTLISEGVLSGVSRFSQIWYFCFIHMRIVWQWVIFLLMTIIFQCKPGLQSCMSLYGINQNPCDLNDDGNWYTTLFLIARLGLGVILWRLLLNAKFTLAMLDIDSAIHSYLQPIGNGFCSSWFYRCTNRIIPTFQCDLTEECRVAPTVSIARFMTKKHLK